MSYKKDETPSAEELLTSLKAPLPHDFDAEKGVLSAVIQDPRRLYGFRQMLQPESFYHEGNRTIWTELLAMEEESEPIDPILLTNRLRDQGKLEIAGGPAIIMEIFGFIPSPAHSQLYAQAVKDAYLLRQTIHGCLLGIKCLQTHGNRQGDEVSSTINAALQTIQLMSEGAAPSEATTATLSECLAEHMEYMEVLTQRIQAGDNPLIPTGIPSLDAGCGGIGQDEFWLVTGPTKSGKSVLTGCIAVNAARKGFSTKVYTNEVGRRTYAGRIIASAAEGINGTMDRKGLVSREQQAAYARAQNELMKSIGKLFKIDNASGKYVEDIVADIRKESESGVKLVIVDLIGKVRTRQRFNSREQELAHISLSLFEAGKRFTVAVIVVAQENEDGQVRESRSLAMDCEAWLKIQHVTTAPEKKRFGTTKEPEIIRDRRDIVVELARGFAAGDRIRCLFDGPRFLIRELSNDQEDDEWTHQ